MGEFNSGDHYIYYYGQESWNGVAIIVKEFKWVQRVQRVQNAVLECSLKNDRMISVCFQGKPFSITVIQVYAPTTNAEEAELEWFYANLKLLLELTPTKDILFIIWAWNAKVGSQEITWSNRQIWSWIKQWSRAKANRVLSREHTGHSKHPPPATQETTLYTDITKWSILTSGWLYSLQSKMENLYTVSKKQKDLGLTVA